MFNINFIHCRFRKIDSTLSGWKSKVEDSDKYQKTVSSFNEGGKKASASISHTATNIRLVYTCVHVYMYVLTVLYNIDKYTIFTYTQSHMHISVQVYMYMYIDYIHKCTCMYAYTYNTTFTYTHAYICTRKY